MSQKKYHFSLALVLALASHTELLASENSGFFSGLKSLIENDPEEALDIFVESNSTQCSDDYPLYITLTNNSSKDITNLQFLAYAHDENYSRAECAETFDLKDRVLKAKQSYSSCWSTLETRGYHLDGKQIPYQMLIDMMTKTDSEVSQKYGWEAVQKRRVPIRDVQEYSRLTVGIELKQTFGCYNVPPGMPWFGKLIDLNVFSGF
jgi:hypothetical protein